MSLQLDPVVILGGGLAGCEAAWQLAEAGFYVRLYEMRPGVMTPAHRTGWLAELVCSNSLKSEQPASAPWLLKQELRRLGSLLLRIAERARLPGGQALVVDREEFSRSVSAAIEEHPRVEVVRREADRIPDKGLVIIATGPLTSGPLAEQIALRTGAGGLFFYDSISPNVDAETINMDVVFRASRYGKSQSPDGDYLNCPFTRELYDRFVDELLKAERHEPHIPDDIPFFEACLPIEELARRGRDTLRFGPMKPVGLIDPRTGRPPYAVVQLRQEDLRASSYNLVGFQNYLKYSEQARVFRLIPGLENAEFLRYGQIHRNTYICSPAMLTPTLQLRSEPRIFFAGQICGVEGYVESAATGLAAGRHAAELLCGRAPRAFPRQTALGSLCAYVSGAEAKGFQPANITFDLLPPLEDSVRRALQHDKRERHAELCRRALRSLEEYLEEDVRVR